MNYKTRQHNLPGLPYSRLISLLSLFCCCCFFFWNWCVCCFFHLLHPPTLFDHNNTKENVTQPNSILPATKQSCRVVPFFLQVHKDNKKRPRIRTIVRRHRSVHERHVSPPLFLSPLLSLLLSLIHTEMGGKREFENTSPSTHSLGLFSLVLLMSCLCA